jgi:phenylpyruvate tautomerase PptA (4-oxalocrotonate tautomerase family)
MPVIDLTLPEGCFERAGQEALAAELTRLIIHWAGGIGRAGYDRASWALVRDAEPAEVGGRPRRPDRGQVYRAVVSVPRGSLDPARRSGLMRDVARAVIAAEGSEPTTENLMRVRCVVDEVPDGSWDVGPGPLRLRDLSALFGAAPDDGRWDGSCGHENRRDHRKGRARARLAPDRRAASHLADVSEFAGPPGED